MVGLQLSLQLPASFLEDLQAEKLAVPAENAQISGMW